MSMKRGDIVTYQEEAYSVVHVYTSDFVEIRRVGERFVSRVILVHKSEVTIQS